VAQRSYTREEMEEILRRAAERTQRDEDGVRHDDLVAAAREVGIDPAAIDDALADMSREKTSEVATARWTREARRAFASHFSAYAIVMSFLGAIDWLVTPSIPWALWVALAWGIGVAFSARRALLPPSERDVEKMLEREARRAAKKARREARARAAEAWRERWQSLAEESKRAAAERKLRGSPLAQAEREIDRAIEEGVNALVSALGKRATDAARAIAEPRTDFERYVVTQKGGRVSKPAPGAPIVTPPPRTRVADAEDERDEEEIEARQRRRRSR